MAQLVVQQPMQVTLRIVAVMSTVVSLWVAVNIPILGVFAGIWTLAVWGASRVGRVSISPDDVVITRHFGSAWRIPRKNLARFIWVAEGATKAGEPKVRLVAVDSDGSHNRTPVATPLSQVFYWERLVQGEYIQTPVESI